MKRAGKNLCKPSKKGKLKKISLSKTFKEQPVSTQLSFSIKDLIWLAIFEDINFQKLSFLFFLIPPINEYVFFEKNSSNNLRISFGLF